jgi:predicted metalloprotease with PDZ domain
MDELFIYQCGLITLQEYLEMQKKNLNRYFKTKGRRFHSLEDSSFNAWIKLYRPDENSGNSTVSYYLKGGIAFWCLNVLVVRSGSNMQALLKLLWERYKQDPAVGVTKEEVYAMVEQLSSSQVREEFEMMIETTQELDLEAYFAKAGLKINFEREAGSYLGFVAENRSGALFIKSVELDGPAYKSGLNAGDEILAINSLRVKHGDLEQLKQNLLSDVPYSFTITRLGQLQEIEVIPGNAPSLVKNIEVVDQVVVKQTLGA